MKIYLLFIKQNGERGLAAVYSSYDNAYNEIEVGEVYCIVETELDRTVASDKFDWKVRDEN